MPEQPGRAPGQPRLHLAHVDGLRALAALMVFVNHAYAQVWNPSHGQYPNGPLELFSYTLVTGHLSVAVFIAISGFCLALPVLAAGERLRDGTVAFLKRRARRILPPYYGAVALCLLLIATILGQRTGTLWDAPIAVNATGIVAHLLLVQDLFATGSINYVFWSIAVEWHIYLVFPVLVWMWRRFGIGVTVLAMSIAGYAIWLPLNDTRVARAHPYFLGIFGMGMLAAQIARSNGERWARLRGALPWRGLGLLFAALVLGLMAYWGIKASTVRYHLLDPLVGAMAACLLVESSRPEPSALTRLLGSRALVWIGMFSYSLYLIHAPLLQLVWQYVLAPLGLGPNVMFGLLMTAGLGLVLGVSYAFFRVLEEPFMRQAKKVRAPAPAVPEPAPRVS